jgi:hypothetical protein
MAPAAAGMVEQRLEQRMAGIWISSIIIMADRSSGASAS